MERTEPERTPSPDGRRRRITLVQRLNLCALLVPGALSFAGWWWMRDDERLAWLTPSSGHFWTIAVAGVVATLAGIGDWLYHLRGSRWVSSKERRVELLALAGGGVPLLVLMVSASLAERPAAYLVPVLVVALGVVIAICYDELSFHRRCSRLETAYHRLLTLGMGVAWLAWVHGTFVVRLARG